MQRMVTVPRGSGMLAMMKRRKGVISGMLLVRVYAMDFFRLSKMRRPAGTRRGGGTDWCHRAAAVALGDVGVAVTFLHAGDDGGEVVVQ